MALFFLFIFAGVAFLLARFLLFLKLRRVDLDTEDKECDGGLFWRIFLFLFLGASLALPFALEAWRDRVLFARAQVLPYVDLMESFYPDLYEDFLQNLKGVEADSVEEEALVDDVILQMRMRWQRGLHNASDEVLFSYMIFLYKERVFLADFGEDLCTEERELSRQAQARFMRLNEGYLGDTMRSYFLQEKWQLPYFSLQEEHALAERFARLQRDNDFVGTGWSGQACSWQRDFLFSLLNDFDRGLLFMRWLLLKGL